jgi:hypothetical protein
MGTVNTDSLVRGPALRSLCPDRRPAAPWPGDRRLPVVGALLAEMGEGGAQRSARNLDQPFLNCDGARPQAGSGQGSNFPFAALYASTLPV